MASDESNATPRPDRIGVYEILDVLGRGGMGVVYTALDPRLERHVALKVVGEQLSQNEEWSARFTREARILASLSHPNVATIHSLERDGDLEFLTMEYIRGQSLADLIESGGLSVPDALSIGRQIARGLEAAHDVGVIHRDLKPHNVMVTPEGHVKVLDFGLASSVRYQVPPTESTTLPASSKEAARERSSDATVLVDNAHTVEVSLSPSRKSSSSTGSGTPGYMSPEQIRGEDLDARSDIWAFGCVLFECLAGTRAFEGATAIERLHRSIQGPPNLEQLPARTPATVRGLIESCLKADRVDRLSSLDIAREVLDAALARRSWEQHPPSAPGSADGAASDRRHNLPNRSTSFIGRSREVAQIRDLLGANRLVTITGVGGGGKTRVALRSGEDLLAAFPDGVWMVELAPVADGTNVAGAVARVLGVVESPGMSLLEGIAGFVAGRSLLLILDNCEHVIEAAAELVGRLLAAAPELKILATSRETLGVAGEVAYQLPPLELTLNSADSFEALARVEAIQLFAQRASQARPGFELTGKNIQTVAEICRRLDALPLAIELAAARVRALSLEDISRRLDDRFRLLRGTNRGESARHQTLEALIDWSHTHLTNGEQLLFRRLSIFRGGWTLEAAEAVCADNTLESWEILDVLTRLIDKSLVVFNVSRYHMLETVREYARVRFTESEDTSTVRERYQVYFAHLANVAAQNLIGSAQAEWIVRIDVDLDNLRAALAWVLDAGETEAALQLSGYMTRYWMMRGLWREARQVFQRAVSLPGAERPTEVLAMALNGLASCHYSLHELDEAGLRYREAVDVVRAVGLPERAGTPLQNLGNVYRSKGELDLSAAAFHEALGVADPKNRWLIAAIQTNIGSLALTREKYEDAAAAYAIAQRIQQETGDRVSEAITLMSLGVVAFRQKRLDEAKVFYEESTAIFQSVGDRNVGPTADINFATTLLVRGEEDHAEEMMTRALRTVKDTGAIEIIAVCLEQFGELARRRGDMTRVVHLFAAAEQTRLRSNVPRLPMDQRDWDVSVTEVTAELGEETFSRLWRQGEGLSQDAAIALALGHVARSSEKSG